MAVLLDTGILYAYYDRSDAWHKRALALLKAEEGGLVVPSPVVPEVDHLLGLRLGRRACRVFYEGLAGSHYFVADLPRAAYGRVMELDQQFADLELGFVDAAVVALSESLGLPRIATTDRRDFEPVARALSLELLP
jgi:predicted nucleic acid-binding protein